MNKLQKEIKAYLKERDWDNLAPVDLAKSVMIEGAELLENFQWNNFNKEEIQKNPEIFSNVKKELADVMIYGIEMAIMLDVDIEKIVLEKLEKVKQKYPAHIVKKKDGSYYKIKEEYRRKGKN